MKEEEHKEPSGPPTASPGTHAATISALKGAWQGKVGSRSSPRTQTAPATPVAGGPALRTPPTYEAWAKALVTLIAVISSDSQDAAGDAGDPGLRATTAAFTKPHPRRRIRLASSSARNTCAESGHGRSKPPPSNIDLDGGITMGTTRPSPAPTRLCSLPRPSRLPRFFRPSARD